jgi:hypothetical protein
LDLFLNKPTANWDYLSRFTNIEDLMDLKKSEDITDFIKKLYLLKNKSSNFYVSFLENYDFHIAYVFSSNCDKLKIETLNYLKENNKILDFRAITNLYKSICNSKKEIKDEYIDFLVKNLPFNNNFVSNHIVASNIFYIFNSKKNNILEKILNNQKNIKLLNNKINMFKKPIYWYALPSNNEFVLNKVVNLLFNKIDKNNHINFFSYFLLKKGGISIAKEILKTNNINFNKFIYENPILIFKLLTEHKTNFLNNKKYLKNNLKNNK